MSKYTASDSVQPESIKNVEADSAPLKGELCKILDKKYTMVYKAI